jgi:ectoine hydroxylase-related dioxygenase (phytanoyl-CoA dioxygenase family)
MRAWREQWEREGYLVIPGFFDPERAARLRRVCDDILEQYLECDAQTGVPGNPDGRGMRHLNHPAYFADRPPQNFAELMDACADELLLGVARSILCEPALFRCTTYWFNPRTKREDGEWHRDTQFVAKGESEEKSMLEDHWSRTVSCIQLQVALAPSDDVQVVPGSHKRWDTPEEYAIRRADDFAHNRSPGMPGALRIALQPGDAALFNPNGLHRGQYHKDKLRRTLMLTYTKTSEPYFDYFSNQPWFLQPGYLDGLAPRTRHFFEPFVAQHKEHWMAPEPMKEAAVQKR